MEPTTGLPTKLPSGVNLNRDQEGIKLMPVPPMPPVHQVQHKLSSVPMAVRVRPTWTAHPSPYTTFRHMACTAARGTCSREPHSCKMTGTGYYVWGLGYSSAQSVPSTGTCCVNHLGQPESPAAMSPARTGTYYAL